MYEDKIVEAWQNPQHEGLQWDVLTRIATVKNVQCGDEVTIAISETDGIIDVARHEAKGCVLCQAGAELLCQWAVGLPAVDVLATVSDTSHKLVKELYGGLPLPNRLSCCVLPIQAMREAVSGK